jgi:hypothetical protein
MSTPTCLARVSSHSVYVTCFDKFLPVLQLRAGILRRLPVGRRRGRRSQRRADPSGDAALLWRSSVCLHKSGLLDEEPRSLPVNKLHLKERHATITAASKASHRRRLPPPQTEILSPATCKMNLGTALRASEVGRICNYVGYISSLIRFCCGCTCRMFFITWCM